MPKVFTIRIKITELTMQDYSTAWHNFFSFFYENAVESPMLSMRIYESPKNKHDNRRQFYSNQVPLYF